MSCFVLLTLFLLIPLASAAEPVAVPPPDKVSCYLKVRRAVKGEDVEAIKIHCLADGSGAIVTYSLSAAGNPLKSGTKELKGNNLGGVEKTFEDVFKSSALSVSEVTALKGTPAERIVVEVERPGIGIWQTSFVPARTEAWQKATDFLKSVSRIAR